MFCRKKIPDGNTRRQLQDLDLNDLCVIGGRLDDNPGQKYLDFFNKAVHYDWDTDTKPQFNMPDADGWSRNCETPRANHPGQVDKWTAIYECGKLDHATGIMTSNPCPILDIERVTKNV